MTEKKVLIQGIEVNYKVFGEPTPLTATQIVQRKPVLVLHGWPSSSNKWEQVADLLDKKHIMMIVPDLPGFGQTPEPKTPWNINNYVEFINEFSSTVVDLQKGFYLLGHSFGGAVAVKFAVKYNQKVEKLFLVSAAAVRKKTLVKKVIYKTSKIGKLFSWLPGYQLFRKAFYKFILKKSDYLYQKGVMRESYLKVISDDLSFYVSSLKVPTIIIWGDKDVSTSVEEARLIHEKIFHSKLIVIPGAGHSLELEVPETLTQKIVENL